MTILYIDDDAEDLEIFRDALQVVDPSIHFMSLDNPREALAYLKSSNVLPEIVLIDMNMPGMNGKLCLQEIRNDKRLDSIRVMIYSTSSFPENIGDIESLGATFVRKANSFNELCELIGKLGN